MDKHLVRELVTLESKLDAVLFAADDTEQMPEKKKGWPKNRIGLPDGSIAAAGLAGAGAMRLRKRYGADQIEGIGNQTAATFRGAAREAGDIAGRVPGALKSAGRSFKASRTLNKSGFLRSGLNAVKKAGKVMVQASAKTQLTTLGEKLDGILEFADENMDRGRRLMLGGPIASAIAAPKGQKGKAFKEQYKYSLRESGKGAKRGIIPGALAGAAVGAGMLAGRKGAGLKVLSKSSGRKAAGKLAGKAALIGAGVGAYGGSLKGAARGSVGSDEIYQKAKRGELA